MDIQGQALLEADIARYGELFPLSERSRRDLGNGTYTFLGIQEGVQTYDAGRMADVLYTLGKEWLDLDGADEAQETKEDILWLVEHGLFGLVLFRGEKPIGYAASHSTRLYQEPDLPEYYHEERDAPWDTTYADVVQELTGRRFPGMNHSYDVSGKGWTSGIPELLIRRSTEMQRPGEVTVGFTHRSWAKEGLFHLVPSIRAGAIVRPNVVLPYEGEEPPEGYMLIGARGNIQYGAEVDFDPKKDPDEKLADAIDELDDLPTIGMGFDPTTRKFRRVSFHSD